MRCPNNCVGALSRVINSRPTKNSYFRRRKCEKCGARWTTWEVSADLTALQETFFKEAAMLRARMRHLEEELSKRSILIAAALKYTGEKRRGPTRPRAPVYRQPEHKWTEAQDDVLIKVCRDELGFEVAAVRLGKSKQSCYRRARILGIAKSQLHKPGLGSSNGAAHLP